MMNLNKYDMEDLKKFAKRAGVDIENTDALNRYYLKLLKRGQEALEEDRINPDNCGMY